MRLNRRYVSRGSESDENVEDDIDSWSHSHKVEIGDGICGFAQVSHVTRCVLRSCTAGCGDCALRICLVPNMKRYCCIDRSSSTCSSSLLLIS